MAQLDVENRINPKKATNSMITRDDFDDTPASLDEIEPGLWLGNVTAATDMDILKERKITEVLTVDSCPLPAHVLQQTMLSNKYIQVSDVAKEDLLSHFMECIDFINNALNNEKNVLVHCYFGVSRSAAVIIAYIMQKYKCTFSPAFEKVKAKRRFVGPNRGFIQQLRLFCRMGWHIDPQHEQYKKYRLRLAADKIRKAKVLPQMCMDLIKSDPGLIQTNPEPLVYRCRKCRRIVAANSNVITHKPPIKKLFNLNRQATINSKKDRRFTNKSSDFGYLEDHRHDIDNNGIGGDDDDDDDEHTGILDDEIPDQIKSGLQTLSLSDDRSSDFNTKTETQEICRDILFLEPLAWMTGIAKQTEGKLNCPKCQTKLGSFNWIMSCHCPCGVQVSPAFYLVPSKVELSRSVQNVQITV